MRERERGERERMERVKESNGERRYRQWKRVGGGGGGGGRKSEKE